MAVSGGRVRRPSPRHLPPGTTNKVTGAAERAAALLRAVCMGSLCSAGGEFVDIAANEGTVTTLATPPAPSYRMRKNEELDAVYFLPADEKAQEYQMTQIGEGARAVILPWSPPRSSAPRPPGRDSMMSTRAQVMTTCRPRSSSTDG